MSDSDSRGPHCDELSCKPLGLGFVYANQPMWRANERQTSQRLGFASLRSRFCYAKKFAFVLCCNISYFLFRSAVVCMQKAYLEQYTAWFGLVGSAKPRSFPFPIMGITPLGLAWLALIACWPLPASTGMDDGARSLRTLAQGAVPCRVGSDPTVRARAPAVVSDVP